MYVSSGSSVNVHAFAVVPEPGGPGGPLAPPIFGKSVNPIPTGGWQIIPTYYYWPPPKVFHLPASLYYVRVFHSSRCYYWATKLLADIGISMCAIGGIAAVINNLTEKKSEKTNKQDEANLRWIIYVRLV